ncbi:MAG TPA: FecR domain-containing protein [Puia sp.]|jgi:ferric-dicitrate binding protein FerR (iron transport regulator)
MDRSSRLNYLFEKYLHRLSSAEEVEELVRLLQLDQPPGALRDRLSDLWESVKEEPVPDTVDWENMYQTVIHSEERLPVIRERKNRTWLKIAAALFILVSGSVLYRNLNSRVAGTVKPVTGTTVRPANIARSNKKQTIHLPDGSTVILNTDSHLDYPSAFTGKTREIYLTGEAYFDIKHDSKKPFLVHTGSIVTRVLGTAFDIKAYPGDESIRVTVTRGKVQVLNKNKSLGLIGANQQISFSRKSETVMQKVVDPKPLIAWKPEEIAFNDIAMLDAAKEIERRFGTKVEFANPLIKNCRVTATFSEDDMLDEILAVICGVTRSQYIIQNNKIIINGKGCNE